MDPLRDEIREASLREGPRRTPRLGVPVCAFCALAFGVLLGLHWRAAPSAAWFALAGCCAALGLVLSGRACRAALLVGVVCFGAGWMTFRCLEAREGSIAGWIPNGALFGPGELLTVEGVVLTDPVVFEPEADPMTVFGRTRPTSWLDLRVSGVVTESGVERASGRLRLRVAEVEIGVGAGDVVRVTGMARPPRPPMNPGESDGRLYARERGEGGTLRLDRAELIERIDASERQFAERARSTLLRWRAVLTRRASRAISDEGESLLPALVLGAREAGRDELRELFQRQGLAHLLAISGFHLAVMAGFAWFALQLTGERPRAHALIVGALVALYLLIVPARPPIWRAGLMVLALLGGELFGRRYDRLGVLAWTAIALLLWRPMTLFDLGFQLSFGLTAVLLTMTAPMLARWFGPEIRGLIRPRRSLPVRAWRGAQTALLVSVLCWAVAAPVIMHRIGIVSTVAPITTVLVLPFVMVLLWTGYALLVAGVLVPPVSGVIQPILDGFGSAAIGLTRAADAVPLSVVDTPPVSLAWTLCATGVVLLWFHRGRVRDPLSLALIGVMGGWLFVGARTSGRPGPEVLLRIDTFAVGDGTCHLLRSGDEAMLWDAGSLRPGLGRRVLPRALRELGVARAPVAIVSHPNVDHFNALADLGERFGLERVLLTDTFMKRAAERPGGGEAYLLGRLGELGVGTELLTGGDEFAFGRATVTVLSPARFSAFEEVNDRSLVVRFVVSPDEGGPLALLMTGDIQREAMRALLDSPVSMRAEVLEMPHHGSVTDSAMEFLLAVDPSVVLQSTGPSRALHPAWRGQRRARDWRATALHGWSWAELRRDGRVRAGSMHGQ